MTPRFCRLGLGLLLLATASLLGACASPQGAPPPGVSYYVEAQKPHVPASATGTLHAPLEALLARFVDDHGDVDYIALATDVAQLEGYLSAMEKQIPAAAPASDPAAASAEKAFWINVYNAAVLRNVITANIPDSVTRVPDFFSRPAFAGLSLDQIKDDKLRKRWNDPRIHAVLSYAARGGPLLERHAFVGADLDWRLMHATVRFCTDKAHNFINSTSDEITLSRILQEYTATRPGEHRCEYGEDFGTTHRLRRLWMARYVHPAFSRYLKNNVPRVLYGDFDWRLNRQMPAAHPPAGVPGVVNYPGSAMPGIPPPSEP